MRKSGPQPADIFGGTKWLWLLVVPNN